MTTTALTTFEQTVLRPLAPRFEQALTGSGIPVDRLIQTVVTSLDRTPKLLEGSQQSILQAAMTAATLGLCVDGVTGQGHLIPFNDKRRGMIAQFIPGYMGYNTIAARAGMSIDAGVVYEGDKFQARKGTDPVLIHERAIPRKKDAKIVAAYAIALHRSLPPVMCIMDIDELM